ncbi:MAG: glycosyltransferase family 2 protein [Jatrophihabitantaceae bacterium]
MGEARDGGDVPAPAFSIVVPVYNVAAHLAECLDSILSQSCGDFEIIAIDDASTDGSSALLDAYAQRDARIAVTHLPANTGLGMARNAGMDRARGTYLMFVDSDDRLADGTLQALADRSARTDVPDVVMFAFARTYPDGSAVPDPRSSALVPEAALRAEARPDLLEIFPSAWNKAYRREFIGAHGFGFPTGFYEDIPWTYPVLMTADPLVTLDRVCYLYRQHGSGNILSSSGNRHLELFAQYDLVFAYIDQHPELEPWRLRLVDRISRHVPGVLDAPGRVPPGHRREFFHAASASFRRHRPAGYVPAVGRLARVKLWLIEHDSYRLFRVAQLANLGKRALRRAGTP